MESVQQSQQNMVAWLDTAEKLLSDPNQVSRVLDRVLSEINTHETFETELKKLKSIMAKLDKRGNQLHAECFRDGDNLIKELIHRVQLRWENVLFKCTERSKALDVGYIQVHNYENSWRTLVSWLERTECALDDISEELDHPDIDPKKLRLMKAELTRTQIGLEAKRGQYDSVTGSGHALRCDAPEDDVPELTKKADRLEELWNTVSMKAEAQMLDLNEALEKSESDTASNSRPPSRKRGLSYAMTMTDDGEIVKELEKYKATCVCDTPFKYKRTPDGLYQIGKDQMLRQVKLFGNRIMVETDEDWITLEEHIFAQDPCRAKKKYRVSMVSTIEPEDKDKKWKVKGTEPQDKEAESKNKNNKPGDKGTKPKTAVMKPANNGTTPKTTERKYKEVQVKYTILGDKKTKAEDVGTKPKHCRDCTEPDDKHTKSEYREIKSKETKPEDKELKYKAKEAQLKDWHTKHDKETEGKGSVLKNENTKPGEGTQSEDESMKPEERETKSRVKEIKLNCNKYRAIQVPINKLTKSEDKETKPKDRETKPKAIREKPDVESTQLKDKETKLLFAAEDFTKSEDEDKKPKGKKRTPKTIVIEPKCKGTKPNENAKLIITTLQVKDAKLYKETKLKDRERISEDEKTKPKTKETKPKDKETKSKDNEDRAKPVDKCSKPEYKERRTEESKPENEGTPTGDKKKKLILIIQDNKKPTDMITKLKYKEAKLEDKETKAIGKKSEDERKQPEEKETKLVFIIKDSREPKGENAKSKDKEKTLNIEEIQPKANDTDPEDENGQTTHRVRKPKDSETNGEDTGDRTTKLKAEEIDQGAIQYLLYGGAIPKDRETKPEDRETKIKNKDTKLKDKKSKAKGTKPEDKHEDTKSKDKKTKAKGTKPEGDDATEKTKKHRLSFLSKIVRNRNTIIQNQKIWKRNQKIKRQTEDNTHSVNLEDEGTKPEDGGSTRKMEKKA